MILEQYDWNVIIIGYWNRAILTPIGIGKRLLGLDQSTPLAVEVPMNGMGPTRVKYDNITISPEARRLVISADMATLDNFDRARKIGVKAIESLPETPLNAAGFNIRVKIENIPDDIVIASKTEIDNRLSDASMIIKKRRFTHTVSHKEGVLNITIYLEKELRVELNFHRQSDVNEELISWLSMPIEDVKKTITEVFDKILHIPSGELKL